MEIRLHPRVVTFLKKLPEDDRRRAKEALRRLGDDPYTPRPGSDIRQLKGARHVLHRLRVGSHRFEYFVEEDAVWVDDAFHRGRGYRRP